MNRIKRFFLKKEEKEMKKFFDSQLEAYARKMEFEITACKRRYDLMNRAFYLFPKGYITGVAQNQNEEVIIVHNEPGTAFYLISQTNQGACYLPRIFYKCYYNYSCEFPKVFIQLVDVITVEDNIGNGSILMEALIEVKLHGFLRCM